MHRYFAEVTSADHIQQQKKVKKVKKVIYQLLYV